MPRPVWNAFIAKHGKSRTILQAATCSEVLWCLKAIGAAGTEDADTVMAWLKEQTIKDVFADNGKIRDDGLHAHDMYLVKVKAPDQVAGSGYDFNAIQGLSGEEANLPAGQELT